ncbi:MAG: aspartyl protease family protein [bacterium]
MRVDAVIDTGATMVVLPKKLVKELGLEKIENVKVKVKYGDGRVEGKEVYGVVRLELKGRVGNFDVLPENDEARPLVGQIVLERLDLIIEPSTRKLIPNPRSPEMPMIEVFLVATSPNSRDTATLRSAQIRQSRTSHVRQTLGDIL